VMDGEAGSVIAITVPTAGRCATFCASLGSTTDLHRGRSRMLALRRTERRSAH